MRPSAKFIILPVLTLVLLIQFSGCSKDPIESLVGTWNFVELRLNSAILGNIKQEGDGTFTFNADGTGVVDYSIISGSNVQSVKGDITWEATKEKVTIIEENKYVVYQRLVNRSKKQILSYTEGYTTADLVLER